MKKINTMKENGKNFFWCDKEEHIKRTKELYGVENVSQNKEIHLKQHNGYIVKHHNGIYYRGTYEKDFVDYCERKNIKISNFKHGINYIFKGKNKIYFPDFYYKPQNLIVEIKSTYTYEFEKDMNEAKRLCSIENGYNFIFIKDKIYDCFETYIK